MIKYFKLMSKTKYTISYAKHGIALVYIYMCIVDILETNFMFL